MSPRTTRCRPWRSPALASRLGAKFRWLKSPRTEPLPKTSSQGTYHTRNNRTLRRRSIRTSNSSSGPLIITGTPSSSILKILRGSPSTKRKITTTTMKSKVKKKRKRASASQVPTRMTTTKTTASLPVLSKKMKSMTMKFPIAEAT